MRYGTGISFLVRARNEEDLLGDCLESLSAVRVPYEVVVLLDRCTDGSERVAQVHARANPRIRIEKSSLPISRAGYETLCTDSRSPHSIVYVWNHLFHSGRFSWRFQWDADFVMGADLTDWINDRTFVPSVHPYAVRFYATDNDGISNGQEYLTSHHFWFDKYWFWEKKHCLVDPIFEDTGLEIAHRTTLAAPKDYWSERPWFEESSDPEAALLRQRYETIVELCGPEPHGCARGSNPEAIPVIQRCMSLEKEIEAAGIHTVGGW